MVSHGVSIERLPMPIFIWVAKCKDCDWKAASPTKNGIERTADEHMSKTLDEAMGET